MAAKFTVDGFTEYFDKLEKLGNRATGIAKKGLYDGAGIAADAIKRAVPRDTGDLAASLYIDKFDTVDGGAETKIGFAGYDRDGVPNQLKANALESGRSSPQGVVGKHPFVRKAFNAVKSKAQAAIVATCEEEFTKIMEE